MSNSRNTERAWFDLPDPEYVQAVQELRKGSRSRPHGSLAGRNRQNERRAAIDRSRRDA